MTLDRLVTGRGAFTGVKDLIGAIETFIGVQRPPQPFGVNRDHRQEAFCVDAGGRPALQQLHPIGGRQALVVTISFWFTPAGVARAHC